MWIDVNDMLPGKSQLCVVISSLGNGFVPQIEIRMYFPTRKCPWGKHEHKVLYWQKVEKAPTECPHHDLLRGGGY